jgi:hypothetical protein
MKMTKQQIEAVQEEINHRIATLTSDYQKRNPEPKVHTVTHHLHFASKDELTLAIREGINGKGGCCDTPERIRAVLLTNPKIAAADAKEKKAHSEWKAACDNYRDALDAQASRLLREAIIANDGAELLAAIRNLK